MLCTLFLHSAWDGLSSDQTYTDFDCNGAKLGSSCAVEVLASSSPSLPHTQYHLTVWHATSRLSSTVFKSTSFADFHVLHVVQELHVFHIILSHMLRPFVLTTDHMAHA